MDTIANMAALILLGFMLRALGDVITAGPTWRLTTTRVVVGIVTHVGMIAVLVAAVLIGVLA